MTQSAIDQLDLDTQNWRKLVDLGRSLERLRSNRDFKKLIMEDYLTQEAVRLVHLKASPAMNSDRHQQAINKDIDAIGTFAEFLRKIEADALRALQDIDDAEATRDELLAEGAE